MKYLVVVESPAKVKTIKSFLGKDYEVVATKGHIRDLPKSKFGISIEDDVVIPQYSVSKDNKPKLDAVKKAAKDCDVIYIATDEDREGEAIGYHLTQTFKDKDIKNYPRIVFHEITKTAVQNAIKNPRIIDMDKVNAQQTRRLLDRIVGYKLSPLLNTKIQRGLSAGRVQSAALKIIVDKEKEILAFKPVEYYKIDFIFTDDIPADLKVFKDTKISKLSVHSESMAKDIQSSAKKANFIISDISTKAKSITTPPPFITSTLQQSASSRLGYSPTRTMSIAQKLYEGVSIGKKMQGIITYMRTDSLTIAKEAIDFTRDFIEKEYGKDYLPKTAKVYKNKSTKAQEAHEAIRPTDINLTPSSLKATLSAEEFRLYELIYNRFLASQMQNAKYDLTSILIDGGDIQCKASGKRLTFDGFYKITPDISKDVILPNLEVGDKLSLIKNDFEQQFTQPPSRYSEASLIKELEAQGIGRPSTYAPIVGTLKKREYVIVENKSIQPQEISFKVMKILEEYFKDIVDSSFTSKMEEELDEISLSKLDWNKVLLKFYTSFMDKIDYGKENIASQKVIIPTGEECPDCKEELVIRKGRYGEFISCSTYPKCKYSKNIKKEGEEELPSIPCDKCDGDMIVKNSRRGQFYGCSNYPKCKNIKPLKEPNKLEVKCPKCGEGDLIERFSKRGKFYGCSTYPDCSFISRYPVIEKKCPKCKGNRFIHKELKTKTTYICCNDDCKHTIEDKKQPKE
jgi:DNA topoisomerase-1